MELTKAVKHSFIKKNTDVRTVLKASPEIREAEDVIITKTKFVLSSGHHNNKITLVKCDWWGKDIMVVFKADDNLHQVEMIVKVEVNIMTQEKKDIHDMFSFLLNPKQ